MGTQSKEVSTNCKKSFFWLVFFLSAIALSVGLAFFRFIVLSDYTIRSQVDCDPYTEACFIYQCDPAAEVCSENPEENISFYKLLDRNARNIPRCNPSSEGCEALACPENEKGCTVKLCDIVAAEEGVLCNDPVDYSSKNPKNESELASPSDEDTTITNPVAE